MAHPKGLQHSCKINDKTRLTGTLSLTVFRRDKSVMANPDGAIAADKMKAPAMAGTVAGAAHQLGRAMQARSTENGERAQ